MEPLLKKKSKEPHYKFKYYFFSPKWKSFHLVKTFSLVPVCVC